MGLLCRLNRDKDDIAVLVLLDPVRHRTPGTRQNHPSVNLARAERGCRASTVITTIPKHTVLFDVIQNRLPLCGGHTRFPHHHPGRFKDSNPGFHWAWNETALKGLIVGALFNEREFAANDGSVRKSTNLARFIAADKVRSGNYTLPKDKLLERPTQGSGAGEGWLDVPAGNDDGLPFA